MKKDNEDIFKKIASQYVETEGENLKKEKDNLKNFQYDFHRLDKSVKEKVLPSKFKKYYPYSIVAAIMLLIMVPVVLVYDTLKPREHSPNLSASTEDLSEHEIIALSFDLPDNFQVAKVELDKGQTIYYIADSNLDDVVMSVEKSDEYKLDTFLWKTEMSGTDVYYKSLADYKIVEINKDGLLYTLTCKYEIDTLMDITKKITEI